MDVVQQSVKSESLLLTTGNLTNTLSMLYKPPKKDFTRSQKSRWRFAGKRVRFPVLIASFTAHAQHTTRMLKPLSTERSFDRCRQLIQWFPHTGKPVKNVVVDNLFSFPFWQVRFPPLSPWCLVYVLQGRSAGSFPKQRLVTELSCWQLKI